jgi:hypothetical protein
MKQIPVQGMSPEELAALNDWAAHMRQAQAHMSSVAKSAKAIHKATIEAPEWGIAVTQDLNDMKDKPLEAMWNIGGPKVNYVDHIEGDPFESPDTRKESE